MATQITSVRHMTRPSNPTRPRWIAALLIVLLCTTMLPTPAFAQSNFDVGVGQIHVTQGIQNISQPFWVDLVAERNTAVRVQVQGINGTAGPVTGKLRVWVAGVEITPAGGLDSINQNYPTPHNQFTPTNDTFANLLDEEERTLNFELLAADYPIRPSGIQTESHDVDMEVEIFAMGDTNASNNIGRVDDLTVVRRGAPWLFKDRIFYLPNGGPPASGAARPRESFIVPGKGDVMAAALWPIPDVPTDTGTQTNPLYPSLLPRNTYEMDCDSDGKITNGATCYGPNGNVIGDEKGLLLARLQARRQLLVQNGFGPDRLVYLFGWVRDGNLDGHDGVSLQGLNVGYGIDGENDGQMVFAHEFGHMVGLPHNSPGIVVDEHGWDVGARLQNNPLTMYGLTGRVRPTNEFISFDDVMNNSPLAVTYTTWVDMTNYKALLDDPKLGPRAAATSCPPILVSCVTAQTVIVTAMVSRIDNGIGPIHIRPNVFMAPWYTEPLPKPENPNLWVTITLNEPKIGIRTVEVPVDATMIVELPDGEGHSEKMGPAVVPVPVEPGTQVVAVTVKTKTGESATIKASAHAPEVKISDPAPKGILGAETLMQWAGDDGDKGASLTYHVAYSPNGGKDFVPVAVDLTKPTATAYGAELPPTKPGQGLLRVFVTDGINSSYTDVGGLSVQVEEEKSGEDEETEKESKPIIVPKITPNPVIDGTPVRRVAGIDTPRENETQIYLPSLQR